MSPQKMLPPMCTKGEWNANEIWLHSYSMQEHRKRALIQILAQHITLEENNLLIVTDFRSLKKNCLPGATAFWKESRCSMPSWIFIAFSWVLDFFPNFDNFLRTRNTLWFRGILKANKFSVATADSVFVKTISNWTKFRNNSRYVASICRISWPDFKHIKYMLLCNWYDSTVW